MIKSNLTENDTLKTAREFLGANWKKGAICPCCNQPVKLYKRKLNSSMAYGLIILYRAHCKDGFDSYIKMNQEIANLGIPSSNVEYAKLAYWKLIEEKPNTDSSKRTSGLWRITENGKKFVLGQVKVPSHALVFNKKVRGYSDTYLTIKESLGSKFNYAELMQAHV